MNSKDAPLFREISLMEFRSLSSTSAGTSACNSMCIVASTMFSSRFPTVWAPHSIEMWIAKSLKFATFVGLDSESY